MPGGARTAAGRRRAPPDRHPGLRRPRPPRGCRPPPVAAADHEIVDDPGVLAVQQIVDGVRDRIGTQPKCRRPAGPFPSRRALGLGQVTTCPGIGALRGVRRPRRLLDILSAAIAFVQQSTFGQHGDRVVVALRMRGLPLDRPVPGERRSQRDRGVGARRCRCACGRRDRRHASGSAARWNGRTATPARRFAGCRCAGRPTGLARTAPRRLGSRRCAGG